MVPFRSIFPVLVLVLLTACGTPSVLKVGFVGGLSGPSSELGIGALRAVQMAVRDVNLAGGIAGRTVELVVRDDGNDPSASRGAFEQLHREGVGAVIGPITSSVLPSVIPFINENHILAISPTISSSAVAGRADWFFRVITESRTMGHVLGDFAVGRGLTDVAVLRETSNGLHTGPFLDAFRQVVEQSGGLVRFPVEFDLRNHPDHEALARALGKAPAYLILANGYDTALVGQRQARSGWVAPILGGPWAMTDELITLGGRQVERAVFLSVYDSQSLRPGWLTFRQSFLTAFGREPGFAAVNAYDAFTLLTEAFQAARSTSPEDLRDALGSLGPVQGLQSSFRLDVSGDVVRDLFLQTIREGRFVRLDP